MSYPTNRKQSMSYPFRIRVIGRADIEAGASQERTAIFVARSIARHSGPVRVEAARDFVWIAHAIVTPDGEVSYPADQIDPPEER